MRSKRDLYNMAQHTVAARRQAARAKAEDERKIIDQIVPGFTAAEEKFRQCGIKAALSGARGQVSALAMAELAQAKAERDKLLADSGRSPNCLEPKFSCRVCKDTGTVAGKTCACVQKLMRDLRREEIESTSSLAIQSFDSLKLEYYPEQKDPVSGRSIRRYMAEALEDLRIYAEEFDSDSANLLLYGNAGLGKTHAALAIAGVVLNKGYDVIYLSSPDFFSRIEDLHFGNDTSGQKELLIEAATYADLLILDDLGTEMVSSFMISTFYTLLNNRTANRRPTIFTTNITDGTVLEKRYTEKISSRLSGSCEPFLFLGDDIRALKAEEGAY